MAQENLKKFYEKVNGDEELQKKIKALADSYTGDKSDEKAAFEAVIAPIAKEAGYEFTYEEAMEAAEEAEDGHPRSAPGLAVITVAKDPLIFADNIGITVMTGVPGLFLYLAKACKGFFFRAAGPGLTDEAALLDHYFIPSGSGQRAIRFSRHFRITRQ